MLLYINGAFCCLCTVFSKYGIVFETESELGLLGFTSINFIKEIRMSFTSEQFKAYLQVSFSYDVYRERIDALLAEGKTTGTNHSEAMIHYTKMNVARMKRIDKTTQLIPELVAALATVKQNQVWLVLTEAWCGDAAQIVPVLAKMADASPFISLRLLLRDEHPELMDAYLTNGGKSIPKLISLDAAAYVECFNWGPRPADAQHVFLALREKYPTDYMKLAEELHLWYAKNKTKSTQKEFVALLKQDECLSL